MQTRNLSIGFDGRGVVKRKCRAFEYRFGSSGWQFVTPVVNITDVNIVFVGTSDGNEEAAAAMICEDFEILDECDADD